MQAKRKYNRFDKTCTMRYKVFGFKEMPENARTVNISGGGICLRSDQSLPIGTILTLEFQPPGAKAPVVAIGKVTWAKTNEDETYDAGVEFWWMAYRKS